MTQTNLKSGTSRKIQEAFLFISHISPYWAYGGSSLNLNRRVHQDQSTSSNNAMHALVASRALAASNRKAMFVPFLLKTPGVRDLLRRGWCGRVQAVQVAGLKWKRRGMRNTRMYKAHKALLAFKTDRAKCSQISKALDVFL